MSIHKTLDGAMEAFMSTSPTKMQAIRFQASARKHFDRDYANSVGLCKLGYGGMPTVNFVEIYVDEMGDRVEKEWIVLVESPEEGWVAFDASEALGYNSFVVTREDILCRAAIERRSHLEGRRKEQDCEVPRQRDC